MACVIWQFVDDKPGHESQTDGLIAALGEQVAVEPYRVAVDTHSRLQRLRAALVGTERGKRPLPDLIVGAGHSTHLPMLGARHAHGGKVVVLMKPSAPLSWFDLCIIPRHDDPPQRDNIVCTDGVLNRIRPSSRLDPQQGLVLVGGPSKHYRWSSSELRFQLDALLSDSAVQHWTIATSRRTPPETETELSAAFSSTAELVLPEAVTREWLPDMLARCGRVWVTEDSVSMLYEALTSGAAVGVLDVPPISSSRVKRGVERLIAAGWVTTYQQWSDSGELEAPAQVFDEAARVAALIANRWS